MNVDKFYKDGYDEWELPTHLNAMVWGQLLSENWVDHIEYKGVPDWSINAAEGAPEKAKKYHRDREGQVNQKSVESVPPIYIEVINELFGDPHYTGWFKRTCGYNHKLKFIDVWNGSAELGWHWDGVEDHDIGFLIYFTEESRWDNEWESYLKLGERTWPDGEVETKHTVYPANGKVILLNNGNPRLVHSVKRLTNNNVNRYTINAGISLWN